MSDFTIVENPSYEVWNSVLNGSIDGNLTQTFEYAEMMTRVYPLTRVIRLLAMDDEGPVGIIQGFYQKRFSFGRHIMAGGVYGCAPVTNVKGDKKTSVVKDLLLALEKYGIRNRIIEAQVYWPESWGMKNIFYDLQYGCAGEFNVFVVDLGKSVDDLWMNIASNKRRNVKKAREKGVKIIEGYDQEDLLSFYRMLEASGQRAGFDPPPFSEFEAFWELCRPKESVKVFLAKWKGKDVAGVFIVIHNRTVYAKAAGSLKEAWNVRPNDILHWEAMKWSCEQGFSIYHMGLVPEPVPTEVSSMWGLWRWKREWNGRLERVHVFDKVYLPNVFGRAYKYAARMKKLLKRLL